MINGMTFRAPPGIYNFIYFSSLLCLLRAFIFPVIDCWLKKMHSPAPYYAIFLSLL